MNPTFPATETMNQRFSCRTFTGEPLGGAARDRLAAAAEAARTGPFGSRLRFRLLAAAPEDEGALKRLGTYGTIRGLSAFLAGAVQTGPRCREDFGYVMESLVLEATALGLGTCWVGGTFTRGTFARRLSASRGERLPAVTAVGVIPDRASAEEGLVRRRVGGSRRKPWEDLFFDASVAARPGAPSPAPLPAAEAGPWADPLEMVRRAPSASNRQPWRVVKDGSRWHFYLRRTPGYPPRFAVFLLGVDDLQQVDMGIAMCHFELAAREKGLAGQWVDRPPARGPAGEPWEYSATWEA